MKSPNNKPFNYYIKYEAKKSNKKIYHKKSEYINHLYNYKLLIGMQYAN